MKVAASILSSDFSNLERELKRLDKSGIDYIHLDVMDGIFVENITFGAPLIKSIRDVTNTFFDVHLMIKEPHRYIKDFVDAGADNITFHLEAESEIEKTIKLIKHYKKEVGISIKPETNIEKLYPYLKDIDLVLIMTVNPGFGGQKFNEEMMKKVKLLKEEIKKQNVKVKIEVDGGINEKTAKIAKMYGVDVCVSGTSIFKSSNMKATINALR